MATADLQPNDLVSALDSVSERDREIYRQYRFFRRTQRDIAEEYGISTPRVCQIIKAIKPLVAKQFMEEEADVRAWVAQCLQGIYGEAIQEWQRSKRPQLASTTQTDSDQSGGSISRTTTGEQGNLQALETARKALADLRAQLGLDAPTQHHVQAERTVNVNLQQIPHDQRHTLADAARVLDAEYTQRIEQTDS